MYGDHEPRIQFVDTGITLTLEEFAKRYPDSSLLPDFRARVEYYRAHKEEIEAEYAAKEAAEKSYHSWDNIRLDDLINHAENLKHRLEYLHNFHEGYAPAKARAVEEVIVAGNNALSKGCGGEDNRETREPIIRFIENAEALFNA